MSFADGWAAINLEMPDRVPRFEPSAAEYHWDLIHAVTGLRLTEDNSAGEKLRGTQAFVRAWDYGIYFSSLVNPVDLNARRTFLGNADYAADGRSFEDNRSCPFTSVEEVLAFDPWETYGARDPVDLVRRFDDHIRTQNQLFPDTVNTTGIYITMMSGLLTVFGWEWLLLAAGTDPRAFGDLMNRYAAWIGQYYEAVAQSEAQVIYSHDDMVWVNGPFIHPEWYRTFIFPNLKRLWSPLRDCGKKILFVCDGDYTSFLEDIAACGNHGFWFEIFTDLDAVCERFGRTHFIIGNGDCRVLTFGSRDAIRAEVERCMRAGKGCPGYFMGISGHIPANVPVENALYYDEVYRELRRR